MMESSCPDISIITPVYNGSQFISSTMQSLYCQEAVQNGDVKIEHIIVDGASKDDTCRIIEKNAAEWTTLISEPDRGMYDALAKGFALSKGNIVCYLNAGDRHLPTSLWTAKSVFKQTDAKWITGIGMTFGPRGILTKAELPFRYDRGLIRSGAYGRGLPFVHQEATLWRRELHECLDLEKLRTFRLAGDHYLWWSFAAVANLDVVRGGFGGFSIHPGQLSEDKDRYFREMDEISGPLRATARMRCLVERLGWAASPSRRCAWNRSAIVFDNTSGMWRRGSNQ